MRCIKSKETVESAEKPLQDPSKTSCSYVNETLSIRHKSTLNWYIVLKKNGHAIVPWASCQSSSSAIVEADSQSH